MKWKYNGVIAYQSKKRVVLCHTGPALAGAGPNARPRRGAPLNSAFMTSSCSVKRVTIMVERRYTAKHQHENWAPLLTFDRKFASSDEGVLCQQWNSYGVSTEFSSARCLTKMNDLSKHHGVGPQRRGAQRSRIGLRPALVSYRIGERPWRSSSP